MFELSVKSHFSAAHKLIGYNGPCENLHGHNYKVEAIVECKELDNIGLGIDFKVLKEYLSESIKAYDHAYLNDLPDYCNGTNTSSENIARFIYEKLSKKITSKYARLKSLTLSESDTSKVTYIPD